MTDINTTLTVGTCHTRNHAICEGPCVIAHTLGRGYPIGKGWHPESEADTRRLVACWNACRGIPTEELEKRAQEAAAEDTAP